MTIAHRFIGGIKIVRSLWSPGGTIESLNHHVTRPSGTRIYLHDDLFPTDESVGYFQIVPDGTDTSNDVTPSLVACSMRRNNACLSNINKRPKCLQVF
jgi:hypothetical protein